MLAMLSSPDRSYKNQGSRYNAPDANKQNYVARNRPYGVPSPSDNRGYGHSLGNSNYNAQDIQTPSQYQSQSSNTDSLGTYVGSNHVRVVSSGMAPSMGGDRRISPAFNNFGFRSNLGSRETIRSNMEPMTRFEPIQPNYDTSDNRTASISNRGIYRHGASQGSQLYKQASLNGASNTSRFDNESNIQYYNNNNDKDISIYGHNTDVPTYRNDVDNYRSPFKQSSNMEDTYNDTGNRTSNMKNYIPNYNHLYASPNVSSVHMDSKGIQREVKGNYIHRDVSYGQHYNMKTQDIPKSDNNHSSIPTAIYTGSHAHIGSHGSNSGQTHVQIPQPNGQIARSSTLRYTSLDYNTPVKSTEYKDRRTERTGPSSGYGENQPQIANNDHYNYVDQSSYYNDNKMIPRTDETDSRNIFKHERYQSNIAKPPIPAADITNKNNIHGHGTNIHRNSNIHGNNSIHRNSNIHGTSSNTSTPASRNPYWEGGFQSDDGIHRTTTGSPYKEQYGNHVSNNSQQRGYSPVANGFKGNEYTDHSPTMDTPISNSQRNIFDIPNSTFTKNNLRPSRAVRNRSRDMSESDKRRVKTGSDSLPHTSSTTGVQTLVTSPLASNISSSGQSDHLSPISDVLQPYDGDIIVPRDVNIVMHSKDKSNTGFRCNTGNKSNIFDMGGIEVIPNDMLDQMPHSRSDTKDGNTTPEGIIVINDSSNSNKMEDIYADISNKSSTSPALPEKYKPIINQLPVEKDHKRIRRGKSPNKEHSSKSNNRESISKSNNSDIKLKSDASDDYFNILMKKHVKDDEDFETYVDKEHIHILDNNSTIILGASMCGKNSNTIKKKGIVRKFIIDHEGTIGFNSMLQYLQTAKSYYKNDIGVEQVATAQPIDKDIRHTSLRLIDVLQHMPIHKQGEIMIDEEEPVLLKDSLIKKTILDKKVDPIVNNNNTFEEEPHEVGARNCNKSFK